MDKLRRKNDEEVEVTWDLLEKERNNPNDLSENEKKALLEHYQVLKKRDREEIEAANQLEKDCKYLTSGAEKCLIPAYGWIQPIKEMAYELEALNIFLRRFHSVITFDQTKEKFGTFRGYYSISPTDHFLYKILTWPLHALSFLLENKVNYSQRYVEVEPRHDVERYVELNLDENLEDCKNIGKIVEISGKKYRREVYSCSSKSNVIPSRHKILWKMKNLVKWLDIEFSKFVSFANRDSRADVVVREALDDKVQKIVDECERKCNDHCIRCGRWIGSGSRRFQTKGWITYICSECAKLEHGAIDCSASSATRAQLTFERRLKKAISECGIDKAVLNGSSSLDEAVKKLGDMKSVKDGVRELVVGKYDDEELYSEEDDGIEDEF